MEGDDFYIWDGWRGLLGLLLYLGCYFRWTKRSSIISGVDRGDFYCNWDGGRGLIISGVDGEDFYCIVVVVVVDGGDFYLGWRQIRGQMYGPCFTMHIYSY